jgi:hypothetical protein
VAQSGRSAKALPILKKKRKRVDGGGKEMFKPKISLAIS